jgi:hypothetical protein
MRNNPCSTPLLHSASMTNGSSVRYFLSASSVARGVRSQRISGTILTPPTSGLILSPECQGCPLVLPCIQEGWPRINLGMCSKCGSLSLGPLENEVHWSTSPTATFLAPVAQRVVRCVPLYTARRETFLADEEAGIAGLKCDCLFCALWKNEAHRGWGRTPEARIKKHILTQEATLLEGRLRCSSAHMLSFKEFVLRLFEMKRRHTKRRRLGLDRKRGMQQVPFYTPTKKQQPVRKRTE